MTILSVAFPLLPVGAGSAGGAEQILFLLDQEYVRQGHRSVVIAAKGSHVSGELIETDAAEGEIRDEVRTLAQQAHRRAIESGLSGYEPDLIHFHGLDFPEYRPRMKTPQLATLHLPLDWYVPSAFADSGLHLNGVSQTQVNGRAQLRLPMIPNGIDLNRFRLEPDSPRDFLLWMGRICPEKGVHIALQAAHRLGMGLLVAGPVHPFAAHQAYFEEEVKPLLDSERRLVGPVYGEEKARLLGRACCVLIPSLAAETSSLVAMEAAASGTPVIAFRSGALPEVVEHGSTGFIVDSLEGMTKAAEKLGTISPARCRGVAEVRFDSRRMARDYLALYESIRGETRGLALTQESLS